MLPFQKHVASRQFRPEMEYGLHSDLDESILFIEEFETILKRLWKLKPFSVSKGHRRKFPTG